jgi:uncharacterized protein (DUF2237 family)
MLRDDRTGGEGRRSPSRNVFGEPLVACSMNPVTGFYRDGCCNTGPEDVGSHTVCVVTTAEFLEFSKSLGNASQCRPSMGQKLCRISRVSHALADQKAHR